jgi:N-carbamoyl-L-amino-acid hydrolase
MALPSGAIHDALHMAELCPAGMLFVPSRGGRSHCPEEDTAPADLDRGVLVLAHALARLCGAG